jgi:hypothetical protein
MYVLGTSTKIFWLGEARAAFVETLIIEQWAAISGVGQQSEYVCSA